jgi:hypothetical protein
MAEQRVCVNCGKQVAAEQTWICNHCGKLFGGEEAEERVRENAEQARSAEEERSRQMAAGETTAVAVEPKPIEQDVISVAHGSEETPLDEPLTDVLRPTAEAGGSGKEVGAFDEPVEYHAFQGDDMRYGWTLEPDGDGRYHSVTLHHHRDGSWEVTADEVFEDQARARRWAERKFRESSGTAAGT